MMAMTRILETALDVSTMTLRKRVAPAGALTDVMMLCRVPDIAAAHDPAIDAAIMAFDWSGALGVYVLDLTTQTIAPQGMPPSQWHQWDWDALAWIDTRTIEVIRSEKSAELNNACRDQIYAGYDSAALGAVHRYPANDKDQVNMIASVASSMYPNLPTDWWTPFWCADTAGAWAYRPHTAAQIQQAGTDGKSAILVALSKNAALQQQLAAAASIADIEAIAW